MRRQLIVVVALASSLILGACGSGGESETTAIPRAEFMAKAREICDRGDKKIGDYYGHWAPKARFHADSEEFMNGVAARIVIPVRTEEIKQIRALGLPVSGEKKLEDFLEALEEGVERGRKDQRSLRASGQEFAFQRAFEMAGDVGLIACMIG